ncbi:MAG TPA: tetratricopeptide repeat protein [Gemmatimonadota bacterium]|nr:tetratricopeptide repeat protein [Gemmatimonadota bacterium]
MEAGPRAPWRRARPIVLAAAAALSVASCAYLNTLYNAEQAYERGLQLVAASDTLTGEARASFESAVEKSAVVLAQHGDSRYADDAMLLLGHSLHELGRHADAAATFGRFLSRFPGSELASAARLGQARSERLAGDVDAAEAALAPLLADPDWVDRPEVLHERAMIGLGSGAHAAAVAAFRRLLDEHPDYARQEGLALGFADAELAAGRHEVALEAYAAYRASTDDAVARRDADLRFAAALTAAGRDEEALATYDDLLEAGAPDSMAARVHVVRGGLLEANEKWDAAGEAYARAAELAPGTATAARATYRRARIAWRIHGDREAGLETMLDAFLHAPMSIHGDSARTAARQIARLLHYESIAAGEQPVTTLADPALARSTALFRLAEEILDLEKAPDAAAAAFERLAGEYAESPWRPRALLGAGLLRVRVGDAAAGRELLREVVDRYPDTPVGDSARRALELPIPERPDDFYVTPAILDSLARALPRPADPMVAIADQMDRYTRDRRPQTPGARPPTIAQPPPADGDVSEPDPVPGRRLPEGVVP